MRGNIPQEMERLCYPYPQYLADDISFSISSAPLDNPEWKYCEGIRPTRLYNPELKYCERTDDLIEALKKGYIRISQTVDCTDTVVS